jgi:type 1 fimbria pilin
MLFFSQQHKAILLLLLASLAPTMGLAAGNSITVTFEASFYARTCKIDVSEPLIEYGPVHAREIMENDSGEHERLNKNIVLTLSECTGTGNLGGSSVIVTGNTVIVNGQSLFKDSGSSEGVGIKLKSNGIAKTDRNSVWDLTSNSAEGNQRNVSVALSCGDCTTTDSIVAGDFKASMTFTVITN